MHIKKQKCNLCSEIFDTEDGLDKHRTKTHAPAAAQPTPSTQPEDNIGVQSDLRCNICGLSCDTPKKWRCT